MDTAVLTKPDKIKEVTFTFNVDGMELNDVRPVLTEEEFLALCYRNPNWHIEQDKHGNIIIMSPVSMDSGNYESIVSGYLFIWNLKAKVGRTYSSSTMFILPDGEKRMPDAAWVANEKHKRLTKRQRKSFARVVPDFVIEVRSPTDSIKVLKSKVKDIWMANGVRLAWLIDPETEKAWVYQRDGSSVEVKGFDKKLSGGEVLPGFEFDLSVLKDG